MKIFESIKEFQTEIESLITKEKTIGFVPTMGALHEGHLALVNQSVAENDYTIVSIFVNPTQFNNLTDLEKYPRNLDNDAKLLMSAGCDIVFAPKAEDIYEENELKTCFDFDFGGLDKVMEGQFRPGHFNGVVQIVSKLFNLVHPTKAYFGEKDFQQLAIIHQMVNVMNYKVEIIDCPIVREPSGLAMSSRNERLTTQQRLMAAEISKVLIESCNFVSKLLPAEITKMVVAKINEVSALKVEYFDIVDVKTLQTIHNWSKPAVGCIAVFCGEVRLIDNIRYTSLLND